MFACHCQKRWCARFPMWRWRFISVGDVCCWLPCMALNKICKCHGSAGYFFLYSGFLPPPTYGDDCIDSNTMAEPSLKWQRLLEHCYFEFLIHGRFYFSIVYITNVIKATQYVGAVVFAKWARIHHVNTMMNNAFAEKWFNFFFHCSIDENENVNSALTLMIRTCSFILISSTSRGEMVELEKRIFFLGTIKRQRTVQQRKTEIRGLFSSAATTTVIAT